MSSGSSEDFVERLPICLSDYVSKWNKLLRVLGKECPKVVDAYVVSLMLVAYFEMGLGCDAEDGLRAEIVKVMAVNRADLRRDIGE